MNLESNRSPIIILSPMLRSGTTLLQRLLCSAPNTLIYGDTVGQEVEFFTNYASMREQMLKAQQGAIEPVRSAVLKGDVSNFITTLSPSLEGSIKGFQAACLASLDVCRTEALDAGREVWGWKIAGAEPSSLARISQWYPKAKFVWVERNLPDCLSSAKAAGMLQGEAEARNFVDRAKACHQAFKQLSADKLILDYQSILEDQENTITHLESFTGAKGIDPTVFSERINQFGNSSYITPSPLTEEEAATTLSHY
ncbi:sulfotransferase [Rubritalea sp.]|uniref:sulfotransferase n=1 Tax=Rubritalea sp. TaxID=2109375 RepID=UPI003EF28B7A